MENKEKTLQEAKKIFEKLKTDPKSVLFSEEKIDKRLLKKLKRLSYSKDNAAEAEKSSRTANKR